jgi:hypothetical protein
MKVFFLTSALGLLAGWWLHASLKQTLANQSPAATQPALSPALRSEPKTPGDAAEIPASEVPAQADAMVKKCAAGGAEWVERLIPLWIRWAEFAPEEALHHVESARSSLPSLNQPWAEDKILAVWASHDAKAAAAWVRDRPVPTVSGFNGLDGSGFETEEGFPALMETLALRDFPVAFSLIPHVFEKRSLRETSSDYTQTWMPAFYASALTEANLPVFLQSLRALSSEDMRGRMCADVIRHLLQQQTPGRRETIAQLPIPDQWPKGVLNPWASLAYDEVKASPEPEKLADEFIAQLKPGDPGRSLMLEWIVLAWAGRDPEAAGRWLRTREEDPQAGNARRAYARLASAADPVTAYEWAVEFGEPRAWANAAQKAYLQQHELNPAEAAEWLMSQDLPPALVSLLQGEAKLR